MKMRNQILRRLFAAAVCAGLCAALCGCSLSLAVPEGDQRNADPHEDKMIGVYITREHLDLFDHEAWLEDNLNLFTGIGENSTMLWDAERYSQRLYAQLVEDEHGVKRVLDFPGVEGWMMVDNPDSLTVTDEEGQLRTEPLWTDRDDMSNRHTNMHVKDDTTELSTEGTIYTPLGQGGWEEVTDADTGNTVRLNAYYLNPVYIDQDGNVYLVQGNGMSTNVDSDWEGSQCSFSIGQDNRTAINGETVTSESVKYEVHFYALWVAERYRFVQLDAEGQFIRADEFVPDALPETLPVESAADCILLERYYTDNNDAAQVHRVALSRGNNFMVPTGDQDDIYHSHTYNDEPRLYLPVLQPNGSFEHQQLTLSLRK